MLEVVTGGFTAVEEARLGDLEAVVARGQDVFVEVGNALAEIRDSKLYRAQYATFDDYCRMRWNFSRQRAYQLITAAAVVANVSTTVDILPGTERQARALSRLEPGEQREVWGEIAALAEAGDIDPQDVRLSLERKIAV